MTHHREQFAAAAHADKLATCESSVVVRVDGSRIGHGPAAPPR